MTGKFIVFLFFIGFLIISIFPGFTENIDLNEMGISIQIPDGWNIQSTNQNYSAVSKDKGISLYIWTVPAENIQTSLDKVYNKLDEFVLNFETMMRGEVLWEGYSTEPTTANIYYISGLGMVGEQVMDSSLALINTDNTVTTVLVYFDAYNDKAVEHSNIAEQILKSVKTL